MSAVSPIRLPTLAFVVNPEGQAGIVYDSPTGKRTVLARGGGLPEFAPYGIDVVGAIYSAWRGGPAIKAEDELRLLAKVGDWTVAVSAKGLAKVLERGEL